MVRKIRHVTHQFAPDGTEHTLVDIVDTIEIDGEIVEIPLKAGRVGRAEAEKLGFSLDKILGTVATAAMQERDQAVSQKEAVVKELDQALAEKQAEVKDHDNTKELLEAQVAAFAEKQAEVAQLNQTLKKLEGVIAEHAESMTQVTREADSLKKETDSLKTKVADLEEFKAKADELAAAEDRGDEPS